MVDLKTLKDLERPTVYLDTGTVSERKVNFEPYMIVLTDKLRQEAIKHIRHLRANPVKETWDLDTDINTNAFKEDWIKHFFNITEEDLK